MLASFAQISPAVRIHRNRMLPVSGTISVRKGQKVNPGDIVAEATLPSHHLLVDVTRAFGIPDPKAVEPYIKRKVGDALDKHDIIAETGGLLSRIIRTPKPGRIVSIRDGQVLIATDTHSYSLRALYPGTVVDILPNQGVVIETSGAVIQAAWGNGLTGSGALDCKADSREGEFTFTGLDVGARGAVLFAGTCTKPDLLVQAAALPIAGLILGTLPASMRETALAQTYPILVLEGFGSDGMDAASWKLLSSLAGKEIILNAQSTAGLNPCNPEALVYAPIEEVASASAKMLTTGQQVRINASPYIGQTGTVERIIPGQVTLPNGLKVAAASIIMDNNERKTIPLNNLDVIGFTS
jgi:hypothetical protein